MYLLKRIVDSGEDAGFVSPLVITFLLPDGRSTRDVWFYESPIGLDFSMRLPMRVKAVKPGFMGEHSKAVSKKRSDPECIYLEPI